MNTINTKTPLEYRPRRKGDPFGGYAETTQMKKLIEWEPKIELKDGVKSYYHWAKQNKNIIPQWL